jgi:hypothetical protein
MLANPIATIAASAEKTTAVVASRGFGAYILGAPAGNAVAADPRRTPLDAPWYIDLFGAFPKKEGL